MSLSSDISQNFRSSPWLMLENCIGKGLDFLRQAQLPYGEFRTYISTDPYMKECCRFASSPYVTTFVLYSLSFLSSPKSSELVSKGLQFLLEEMEDSGIWRFFTTNRHFGRMGGSFIKYTETGIVPDLDVMACVSYCLAMNGVAFGSNLDTFLANRDDRALYYTWLLDYPLRPEYNSWTNYICPRHNDVCSGVNANILLYLGYGTHTIPVLEFLRSIIHTGTEENTSVYFPGTPILCYLISRAFFANGIPMDSTGPLLTEKILHSQKDDGSFGSVLFTAFSACTLINLGFSGPQLSEAMEFIINSQNTDGSWERCCFFIGPGPVYYGSGELTASICIEALERYRRRNCS